MANFASLTVPLNNGATYLFGIVLGGLFAYVAFKATRKRITDLPLPPGPMPLPLIGNVLNMPMKDPWETFTKWNTKHGEIVHVSVFNQPIIIVNSPRTVSDLLEKRYALYSDRPRLPLVSELDWSLTLMPYNEVWRTHRRVLSSRFGPSTAELFHPAHDFASINLLNNLSLRPEEFEGHIRLYMTQGILMSTYGIIPRTRQDTFVVLAERQLSAVSKVIRPGVFLADAFPIRMIPMREVPSWVPGAASQKMADQMVHDAERMKDIPFLATKEMMSSGTLPLPCFVSDLLEDAWMSNSEMSNSELEYVISECAMQAYGGGSDTCVAQLSSFILAMTLNPAVQRNAQSEIDKVVGTSRLPTLDDRKNLPYMTAVMKEVLRWHVVAPQGMPHMLREDNMYDGYHIPKGSIIIVHSWGILHNPELYCDPMEFRPERFFDRNGRLDFSRNDPAKFAFGFGRRVCPGHHFAESALHLAISRILAAFDISPAKDKNGVQIPVAHRPLTGAISHPNQFCCTIVPRSLEAKALIQQARENMSQMYNV